MGLLFNSASEAASKARSYQSQADASAQQAVALGNQAISSAKANQGVIANYGNASINNALGVQDRVRANNESAQTDINSARGAAGQMGTRIGAVSDAANQVNATAQTLTPYADQLSSYAKQLAASGDALTANGGTWLQNAQSLMNLDPNAGGLIGKYVGNVNATDPNNLVSLAASDVQQSYDNASGQMAREITRKGGSMTSGNALAAQADLTRSLAAALAGAKTRTRISGLKEQTETLRTALADAMSLQSTGNATIAQGNSATQAAANATTSAASVVANKGNLEATSGNLSATAAQLTGTLANVYTSIAQMYGALNSQEVAAGSLVNNAYSGASSAANTAASNTQSAYNSAISAQNAMTNYAATQASEAASLASYLDSLSSSSSSSSSKNNERGYTSGSAHTISNDTLRSIASVG